MRPIKGRAPKSFPKPAVKNFRVPKNFPASAVARAYPALIRRKYLFQPVACSAS